ncbi:ribonuclease catalytic domain-containing protein [Thermodesulfobacteriota bacterium]
MTLRKPTAIFLSMEQGTLVEFIDRKQIVCAVVIEEKNEKARLLTAGNREASIAGHRLLHPGKRLDVSMGRDHLVASLCETVRKRENLKVQVNIPELWEILHTEDEWIDAETMASFCFDGPLTTDHISAVVRAFFENRLYFKFEVGNFRPYSVEQVAQIISHAEAAARKEQFIREGADWIRRMHDSPEPEATPEGEEIVTLLRDYYLFENGSENARVVQEMLVRAELDPTRDLFPFLVHIGVWGQDENTDLYRLDVSTDFPPEITQEAVSMVENHGVAMDTSHHRDLTSLPVITIDGQSTLDFDDAISIETDKQVHRVGIHISDVAHFIERDSELDRLAETRGSSIYMPDRKIPMLPPVLAEGLLSLRCHEVRTAVSVMVQLTPDAEVLDYEIFQSLIRVRRQLTYHDVNLMVDMDKEIVLLHDLALKLRAKRLEAGALHISLPEISIWIDEAGGVNLHRISRESPSRVLVSEIMILGNRIMADFLSKQRYPAVFRSQPEPRVRMVNDGEGTLFQNWMQRRHLNRFMLSPEPEPHSGLGVAAYVTATSPIRKYLDLVTQRQLRGVVGGERPYSREEIERITLTLHEPLSRVGRLQASRQRYWILKFLESRIGSREEAMVLEKRRDKYILLLTDYLIESSVSASGRPELKPEDIIGVIIEKVDPRNQTLSVAMA